MGQRPAQGLGRDRLMNDFETARADFGDVLPRGVSRQDQRGQSPPGSAQDFLRGLDAAEARAEPLVGHDAAEAPAVLLCEIERVFAVGGRDLS